VFCFLFAALNFYQDLYRGTLLTTLIQTVMLFGVFAGFYSSRIYKMFEVTKLFQTLRVRIG